MQVGRIREKQKFKLKTAKKIKIFSLEVKSENEEKSCSCFYNSESIHIKFLLRSQRLKCFSFLYLVFLSFPPQPAGSHLYPKVFSLQSPILGQGRKPRPLLHLQVFIRQMFMRTCYTKGLCQPVGSKRSCYSHRYYFYLCPCCQQSLRKITEGIFKTGLCPNIL